MHIEDPIKKVQIVIHIYSFEQVSSLFVSELSVVYISCDPDILSAVRGHRALLLLYELHWPVDVLISANCFLIVIM